MDIIGVMLAAAIAGIGSGIGVAIGQALYKAFFEDKVTKFLDKKHREEALKKLTEMDPAKSIIFGERTAPTDTPTSTTPTKAPALRTINSESVVNKMLGR